MNHSFNVEIATKIGVEKAVLLENISFWIKKNIANGKHFRGGETWTYNSARAFSELFPYFTPKKVARLLLQLENEGYLKSGSYNQSGYDRTKWYTVSNEWVKGLYLLISQNCPMEDTKLSNGSLKNGHCNKTDINTDIKEKPSAPEDAGQEIYMTKKGKKLTGKRLETFMTFWDSFDYKKGKAEAADCWLNIPSLTNSLVQKICEAAKIESQGREESKAKGKTPKMAEGWLSGRRWEDEGYSSANNSSTPEDVLKRFGMEA